MLGFLVFLFVVIAFFTGLYYITAGYSVATGFATITVALIVAAGWFKYEDRIHAYMDDLVTIDEPHEVFNDTVPTVEDRSDRIIVLEVHDTVFVERPVEVVPIETVEDSVVIEIVSEVELTEAQIDSIANDVLNN